MVMVDDVWRGERRQMVMQANRNSFFYVLDRRNGQFLMAEPFVKKMNWASNIGQDGRPVLIPGREPTVEGTFACPAVRGATNWYSTAYSPDTRLFYVMAAEDCGIFRTKGNIYGANVDVQSPGQRFLRAIDSETGRVVWQKALTGSQEANYSGVLSTKGGLVFHGETSGGFSAVDAGTGKTLWHVPVNDAWRASPMTYMVAGKQICRYCGWIEHHGLGAAMSCSRRDLMAGARTCCYRWCDEEPRRLRGCIGSALQRLDAVCRYSYPSF
jgi:alcohol dehydrogenase (cytochrome c)